MRFSTWCISVGLIGSSLCCLTPSAAKALSLSPSILEAQLNPGETKELTIRLVNDESVPLLVQSAIQKFIPQGKEGHQEYLPLNDRSGAPSWTTVQDTNEALMPGERRDVRVRLQVPETAALGGAYETIFFSGAQITQQAAGSLGLRSRIGTLLLLTIGDLPQPSLQLTDWRMASTGTCGSLQGVAHVTLKNVGRTHLIPSGEVVVRNGRGVIVERYALNPAGSRVLPAGERDFSVPFGVVRGSSWLDALQREVVSRGSRTYSLSLEGVEGLSAPAPLLIQVFPWHVVVSVGGIIIVLLALFVLNRRYLVHSSRVRS